MHPAELLWAEHSPPPCGYPVGVLAVPKPIRGTAFFPGGYGLWNPNPTEQLPEFPIGGVMVLGHDFHSEVGYLKSLCRGFEDPMQPTWRNLRALLNDAEINLSCCFFTNAYMGLRAGPNAVGMFPGEADPEFVTHCRTFLVRQIEVQRPSLIVTLGMHVPAILAPLSPVLGSWVGVRRITHLDAVGPLQTNVCISAVPGFKTTVVALVHPSMRHASVRHREYDGYFGAEAEMMMLRAALAHAKGAVSQCAPSEVPCNCSRI